MQVLLVVAGVLALMTAGVHSVLGERLLFRALRRGGLVPSVGAPPLHARHIHILWATWHLASVFGVGFAAVLLYLAAVGGAGSVHVFVLRTIVVAHLGGALLVLVGTRGRHPGWVALLLIAALTGWAAWAA